MEKNWKERFAGNKDMVIVAAEGAIEGAKDAAIILGGIGIFFACVKYCKDNN
jgi:hypothetical protein